ncbi:TonB-dependent receptor [Vibrio parahaemolyticus]|uniref:TonB-dependent receptor plug domain-containing protein n=1 Tax=Vibrio parahaemolyticus TaxID=670 RepID=UPI0004E1C717|nr:TonB-dependent receptor [Vibrio parahaemolyticus]EJE4175208.1 TonB-dependent receptor [Vibrio parahaemolyticus]MCR9780503.1 TonB-dependent receptor [Vibrio parahaemolyticus]MDF4649806.1 TonB-dependent receptor [Vibrio parahaemolyticus]MDG3033570.1 TonB-dependent receptor [Vibrio parahaemolyticus]MDK9416535.1 TonB-dependent receptor [Vibrio parahaemolyticus]
MYKNTTALSVAISLALGTAAAVAPLTAQAEEQQVEKLQKMKVTGSRLTRASMEGSTPVAVIGRAEIERAGDVSIADVLRKSSFNSFGSHNERSGSSAQSQATISLRGLGSERTLVLINGKRLPGSASMGGGAANINVIPSAIVERVEVMADGGSAVYGSDAVAGVVNIILKEEFDGINVTLGSGIPSREGADEENVSIVLGTSGEKGNIMFSFEHDSKDEIYQRDRDYLSSTNTGSANYFDMSGVSIYGRNVYHDGQLKALKGYDTDASCDPSKGFVGLTNYPGLGDICGYDYTSEAAQTASLERNTVFMNGNIFLSDDTTFNAQMLLSRNESFGRFAPAAGSFDVDPNTSGGADFFAENGLDTTKGPASVYYRFNNVGTRDTTVKDFQADFKAGLDGTLYTDSFGEVIWEAGYHLNFSNSNEVGTGYVFGSAASNLVESGQFVNGEFSADATNQLSAGTSRESQMEMHQFSGGLQFDLAEVGDITIPLYVGAEFTTYDYFDKYDPQSEAGNIIGSAGNSAGGDRETYAFYAESMIAFTDELEMNIAARYDHYSDFGDEISPKVSFRYQPLDNLMFRAGAGMGFRAPTLSDLYAADSYSSDFAKDYSYCSANGIAYADCPETQYDVTRTANEDLEAETSVSFNFGVSYSPIDDLDVTVDYYNISIDDMITLNTLQSMIDEERSSGVSNPNIIRDANGRIIEATAGLQNLGTLDTSGIDLKVGYSYDFDFATVRYDFMGSYVLDYSTPEYVGGPVNNQVGRNGLPEYRFNTGVGLNFLEDHDIYLSADHIADQAQDVDDNYNKIGHISSQTTWNIAYNYLAPWDAKFTAGVRNLTDEDPAFESDGVTYNSDLYSIQGRVYFLKYSQNF